MDNQLFNLPKVSRKTALRIVSKLKRLRPCDESGQRPIHPGQLTFMTPTFGHEYGFKWDGLRVGMNVLTALDGVRGWDLKQLSQLVDVITWGNVDTEFGKELGKQMLAAETLNGVSDVIAFANFAYLSLHHPDNSVREHGTKLLLEAGIIAV